MVRHAFFPSTVRAQVTALACTLPPESGRALLRWSASELAAQVRRKRIVSTISASTIRRWLRQERIKPWQYRSWQKPTDPRFLEKATVVLQLYEQAARLAQQGEIVVCADEKTCMQALTVTGGVQAAHTHRPLRVGCRYRRQGIVNLFAALLVHTGQTMARCYARKRFVDFTSFLSMLFGSLWCKRITGPALDFGQRADPCPEANRNVDRGAAIAVCGESALVADPCFLAGSSGDRIFAVAEEGADAESFSGSAGTDGSGDAFFRGAQSTCPPDSLELHRG